MRNKIIYIHPAIRTYRVAIFELLSRKLNVEFFWSGKAISNSHISEEINRILQKTDIKYIQANELHNIPLDNFSWVLLKLPFMRYKVYIFSNITSVPYLLLAPILKLFGKKIILFDELWKYPIEVNKYKKIYPYVKFLSKYCLDGVVTSGSKAKEFYINDLGFDKDKNALFLTNPGNKDLNDYRKENVGIKTRHGFTYGKYIAKIRFPKIINSSYVWNGLTCAFWLKYQKGNWNTRSNCISGFNPKLYSDSAKVKSSTYSEIDIEIVKTSKFWPKTSYGGKVDYPKDNALNKNIIVSCTNWDLACHDPDSFNTGVRNISYDTKKFTLHRWDDDYRALTSKYELNQDSVLGRELYYVIEWHPKYIIWKIGPTRENLFVIGYMDNKSTMIPDNQMELVFTQEFHLSEWWPLTPFKQEFIPYPLNEITGYIYEVEIE